MEEFSKSKLGIFTFEKRIYKSNKKLTLMKHVKIFEEYSIGIEAPSRAPMGDIVPSVSKTSPHSNSNSIPVIKKFKKMIDTLHSNPNGNLFKVVIKLDAVTPGLEYGGVIEGIDAKPFTAGIYALSKAWDFTTGNSDPIMAEPGSLDKCGKILKRFYSPDFKKSAYDIITDLCNGEMERDHFKKFASSSEVSIEVFEVPPGTPSGGFVVDSYEKRIQ
jgi:hypothetical protein